MTKSIVEKLNLHKYEQVAVLYKPEGSDYLTELNGYDTTLTEGAAYDLIFAFVLDMESLRSLMHRVIEHQHLKPGGYLFAAYPKKGNKVYPTFIHRDELLGGLDSDENGYVGTSSIKFARMVGLDDVFTVVGFKEDAKGKSKADQPSTKSSQRVDDYIALIPEIEKDLADMPELLAIYQALTPGYRKDWARYVYSAKQEETKAARREEMKMILQAGYKSRELYRKDQSN
ncbi:YdeI/OmpD-associated family protein [Paenibacillus sp. GCM10027629]|uniref:YdeI/OmpD-associated family protein n=1 Tax=Paenibacillus sp. GCM10027629 TaxID=3273414 RepID=UPI00363F95EC